MLALPGSQLPARQHDNLGISHAMLVWAARHPHLGSWVNTAFSARKLRKPRSNIWLGRIHVSTLRGSDQILIEGPPAHSAIGVWLPLDFRREFNKSPNRFGTRREIGLAAAPVVYRPQKLLRYPHLEQAILRAF